MKKLSLAVTVFFLFGCSAINRKAEPGNPQNSLGVVNEVEEKIEDLFRGEYEVTEDFKKIRPKKVAILPFVNETEEEEAFEIVRKSFYNHFSSRHFSDLEIYKVDTLLRQHNLFKPEKINQADAKELGKILKVDAVIYGKITQFDRLYAVLYSQAAVGVEVSMVDTGQGKLLWKATDVSRKHEGGISLSPWGLAVDAAQTALNMRNIQLLRASDDLFRSLLKTLPRLEAAETVRPPQIYSLEHDSPGALKKKGDIIKVAIYGEAGQTAFFDLGDLKQKIVMKEDSKGLYLGSYQVAPGDNVHEAVITGYLINNQGNRSNWRDVLGPVTIDTQPPESPTKAVAKGLDKEVLLRWLPNQEKDLARYTVYRSLTPLSGYRAVQQTEITSYRDREVKNHTGYYYRISASDRAGNESSKSETVRGFPVAPGPTEVGSPIKEDTVWYAGAGPYLIKDEVVVEKGAALTIEAGTIIKSAGGALRVRGKLLAEGNRENLIIFTCSDDFTTWEGIIFDNTGTTQSRLKFVKIQQARAGVTIDSSSPTITMCDISKNGMGIKITGAYSQPVIERNSIAANNDHGVFIADSAFPRIAGNNISDNLTHGITCERSRPKILNNIIANNAHIGIRLIRSPSAKLEKNRFSQNGQGDLFIDDGKKQVTQVIPEPQEKINLFEAAFKGNTTLIKKALKQGVDINQKFKYDWTAVMGAAAQGKTETVRLLLDNGADINAQGKHGNTSLIVAAKNGHLETVKILLNQGARVNAKTNKGITALGAARVGGHQEIEKLLLEKGAEKEAERSTISEEKQKKEKSPSKSIWKNLNSGFEQLEDTWKSLDF